MVFHVNVLDLIGIGLAIVVIAVLGISTVIYNVRRALKKRKENKR